MIIPVGADELQSVEETSTLHIEGLDVEKAIGLLGSEALLLQVMREYYHSLDKRIRELTEMLFKGDYTNYTINVHSLKSTSRQIGADELGELAFKLEMAGKQDNSDFICEHHAELIKMCAKVRDILKGVFPDDVPDNTQKKSADDDSTRNLLDKFAAAMEEFDTLAMDEVVEEMSKYSYDEYAAAVFIELETAAKNCDMDACTQMIEEWRSLLK